MSKQYGLIIPNSKDKQQPTVRPSIFGSDSDEEAGPSNKPTGISHKLKKQDEINRIRAIEEDPTVYPYDEIYDKMDKKRKESKLSRKDLDRKPKYISRLLLAADQRKRENERRIERQVQKEREAEGDEFKDKEAFVTSAYKKKLEEMKEMEEKEKREEYLEAIGDVTKQGNLDGFYRHLYEQKVNIKEEVEDAEQTESTPKSPPSKPAQKREYRKRKNSSDSEPETEGDAPKVAEIEVKKEHITSNLDADSDFSIDSSSEDEGGEPSKTEKVTTTDNQTELSIAPVDKASEKTAESTSTEQQNGDGKGEAKEERVDPPEPKKPKIDIWKKRTVGEIFDAAVQRYFERRSLREL